ncbi:DUF1214 domain-containing protein [Ruegeria atlantica]|uniref:DUF1214 domain-containing protein n=1 Tax=Ruegeria atlantica TaxID=81569 RepID=A0A0P1EDG5_9RHOB|nr:DUF1214 domain-containing protein [Ruegeria atlantica]CUH47191.1 hypothetical protein RUA4292_01359 [Ruegeria atlantica]
MSVYENLGEVPGLGKSITMDGGKGNMIRNVQRFSSEIEWQALEIIYAIVLNGGRPSVSFGKRYGDVGELSLAAGVQQRQLGTPPDAVGYNALFTDIQGELFNGEGTHKVTVPAGIVHDDGYRSITVYGSDDKLLIPNDQNGYDRTTFLSGTNEDETHTVTHSPDGSGQNGIPTRTPIYVLLRAYLPVAGAVIETVVEKQYMIMHLKLFALSAICSTVFSGACIGGQMPVTLDNYKVAEAGLSFSDAAKIAGEYNVCYHPDGLVAFDEQAVDRMNCDTVRSAYVADVSNGGTITLRDARDRYLSAMVVQMITISIRFFWNRAPTRSNPKPILPSLLSTSR